MEHNKNKLNKENKKKKVLEEIKKIKIRMKLKKENELLIQKNELLNLEEQLPFIAYNEKTNREIVFTRQFSIIIKKKMIILNL